MQVLTDKTATCRVPALAAGSANVKFALNGDAVTASAIGFRWRPARPGRVEEFQLWFV